MPDYILLQDGSGQITLQDGSGQVLLQSEGGAPYAGGLTGFQGRTLVGTQYRRRPQLGWHDDDGLSVVADTGSTLQVSRSLEQWRLARAARFSYWAPASDVDAAPPAEADTLAPFLARRPLRGLGRNPYLWHQDYDSAPAAPEADIFAPFFVRRSLRGLGRNPYLFHTAQDLSFTPEAEADTWIPFLVRRDITGRLRAVPAYVLLPRSAQDEDAPAPPAADVLRRLLINVGR